MKLWIWPVLRICFNLSCPSEKYNLSTKNFLFFGGLNPIGAQIRVLIWLKSLGMTRHLVINFGFKLNFYFFSLLGQSFQLTIDSLLKPDEEVPVKVKIRLNLGILSKVLNEKKGTRLKIGH